MNRSPFLRFIIVERQGGDSDAGGWARLPVSTKVFEKGGGRIKRKLDFDDVVRENSPWLLSFVRRSVPLQADAEDLVQEIFLRAFRAYDSYDEKGSVRTWLRQIARRAVWSYHEKIARAPLLLMLDAETEGEEGDGYTLYDLLPDETAATPEETILQKELTARVLTLLRNLPPEQRTVLTCRFWGDLSVKETAARMGIPKGSVKSSTFYGLEKLRQGIGFPKKAGVPSPKENRKIIKGALKMNCNEAQLYLFQYAAGKLPEDDRTAVTAHLDVCPRCRKAATALGALIPQLPEAKPDEFTHFSIAIPDLHLVFSWIIIHMDNSAYMNKILAENGGKVPEDCNWFGNGSSRTFPARAFFDNEGHRLEFQTTQNGPDHLRYRIDKFVKIYDPLFRMCMVVEDTSNYFTPKKAKEAPNLFAGNTNNSLDAAALEGLYIAIPKEAANVRIRRGNGVLDGNTYQFVYSCRYVENETHRLEYSYNLN